MSSRMCHDFCVADQVNLVLLFVRGCVGVEEEAQVLKLKKLNFILHWLKLVAFVISVSMSPVSPVFHTIVTVSIGLKKHAQSGNIHSKILDV